MLKNPLKSARRDGLCNCDGPYRFSTVGLADTWWGAATALSEAQYQWVKGIVTLILRRRFGPT
jgi:hypothetical protein